jgi:hypothetical protein
MTQATDFRQYVGHDGIIAHLHTLHLEKPAIHPPLAEWDGVRFAALKVWFARLLRKINQN